MRALRALKENGYQNRLSMPASAQQLSLAGTY
jgi:hypothetical protein